MMRSIHILVWASILRRSSSVIPPPAKSGRRTISLRDIIILLYLHADLGLRHLLHAKPVQRRVESLLDLLAHERTERLGRDHPLDAHLKLIGGAVRAEQRRQLLGQGGAVLAQG